MNDSSRRSITVLQMYIPQVGSYQHRIHRILEDHAEDTLNSKKCSDFFEQKIIQNMHEIDKLTRLDS